MSNPNLTTQAAAYLAQRRTNRQPFDAIPDPLAPQTEQTAYTIQDDLANLLTPTHGPIRGYKIALTSAVAQQQLNIHQPIAGFILANTIHNAPCTLQAADYLHLGLELENAVTLDRALPPDGAPYTRQTVAPAVGAAMTAFEIVDDRNADYTTLHTKYLTAIADNIWNAGLVLGTPVTDWQSLDLAAAQGTMQINHTTVGIGHGSDVMGHPLTSLAWLANNLAARNQHLKRGDHITTGTFVRLHYVKPGDIITGTVTGLGEITVHIT